MTIKTILIPDIGGAKNVDVIELLVAPGDKISAETSLVTLEGDKATMEIPSPYAGTIKDISIKVGDKVSQGCSVLTIETSEPEGVSVETSTPPTPADAVIPPKKSDAPAPTPSVTASLPERPLPSNTNVHAGPSVRRIAREFGVDLSQVTPTGEKNRIIKEDVQLFVKTRLSSATTGGFSIAPSPVIDFSQFGEIETKPLNKIKKLTGINLHRSWVTVPHVTQFGESDITEMEAFREQQKAISEKKGFKLTPLVFIMKAVVTSLKAFPQFNASLHPNGESLILKKYYHLGVAVDTPNGLVVPVVRDVDKKGIYDLAQELAQISAKARDKGLSLADMQGGCFTISSLGGIGGTAFTPIVNAPDVAILGISKASIKPIYQEGEFVPRLMLPLSLSYDHRVIDGADGARFMVYLSERLTDIRTLLL